MIKSITFQGNRKFAANLYALEIKSRFIDQTHADGYYSGYGAELEAKVVGNQIQIGTGAFVVQGRISEVVSTEVVTPTIYNNFVGYVVARIETYHVSDDNNCTFKAYVNTALSEIPLRQDDVYATNADNENLVYELPIYSFEIKDRTIINLQKLIKPIDDYARIQEQISLIRQDTNNVLQNLSLATSEIAAIADAAKNQVEVAVNKANESDVLSNEAKGAADRAIATANNATDIANTAKQIAVINEQHQEMVAEINEFAQQIGEKQGTTITRNGEAIARIPIEDIISSESGNFDLSSFTIPKYFDSFNKIPLLKLSKIDFMQHASDLFNEDKYIDLPPTFTTDDLVGAYELDLQRLIDVEVEDIEFEEAFLFLNTDVLYQPHGETTLFSITSFLDLIENNCLLAPYFQTFRDSIISITWKEEGSSQTYLTGIMHCTFQIAESDNKIYIVIFASKVYIPQPPRPSGLQDTTFKTALYYKIKKNSSGVYGLRSAVSPIERIKEQFRHTIERVNRRF